VKRSRRRVVSAFAAAALWATGFGCGEDPGGGVVMPPPPTPFATTAVFLRPLAIDVPPAGGGRPVPALAVYNLTAFYRGGAATSAFDWTVPAAIGTVVPKTPQLGIRDATVLLQTRTDATPPLGFFDITAAGVSGSDSSAITSRFAVVRNTWMRHARLGWVDPEPDDPVSSPVMLTAPGRQATQDSIFFVQQQAGNVVKIRRIPAFTAPTATEPIANDATLVPQMPEPNNFIAAPQLQPDLSPPGLGRREMLFASRMDSQYRERCPTVPCRLGSPLNLWVVRTASGIVASFPRQVTFDSSRVEFGRLIWYAFDFQHPRWDPTATGPDARIAFLSNVASGRDLDLWTAVLRDRDGDGASDTLETFNRLTMQGSVAGFSWHPDGTRLCVARAGRLEWIDAASGAPTPIVVPDNTLARFLSPSVYVGAGQPTPLIAFQAQTENQVNIYVLDEAVGRLARVLPYPVPVTHNLFPRWHPYRKAIVYVGDYTVAAWASSSPPNLPIPDVLNPNGTVVAGMPRTKYPSPWILELE
jgi:hypothetical protein